MCSKLRAHQRRTKYDDGSLHPYRRYTRNGIFYNASARTLETLGHTHKHARKEFNSIILCYAFRREKVIILCYTMIIKCIRVKKYYLQTVMYLIYTAYTSGKKNKNILYIVRRKRVRRTANDDRLLPAYATVW